jgi:hypothetical protein
MTGEMALQIEVTLLALDCKANAQVKKLHDDGKKRIICKTAATIFASPNLDPAITPFAG